jgi:hypothetical protein
MYANTAKQSGMVMLVKESAITPSDKAAGTRTEKNAPQFYQRDMNLQKLL